MDIIDENNKVIQHIPDSELEEYYENLQCKACIAECKEDCKCIPTCNCENITPQSKECYSQMITVEIPEHMKEYRNNRVKAGLSSKISIDPCIYDEICELWKLGIITYGSCCGHNKQESFVNVDESNISKMLEMNYVQNHHDKTRKDTFKLKIN